MKEDFLFSPLFVLLQYVLGAVWFIEVERINDRERIKRGGRGVEGEDVCVCEFVKG